MRFDLFLALCNNGSHRTAAVLIYFITTEQETQQQFLKGGKIYEKRTLHN